ncbi:MAG: hypothetical protein K8S27_15880 [Candidatus Omnitrophica bacterium]|nr:hypothetical protein [Candidatus Omnitrophota bacterium]
MEKNNTTPKMLGPKETEVVSRLSYEKASVVTTDDFDRYFKFSPETRKQIIFRLKRKGVLTAVKKGVYIFSPLESGPLGRNINEFEIVSLLFPKGNYYIGYATMYNYHGFTEQIFQTMYILNTTRQGERVIANMRFKMIRIPAKRMYGLEKVKIGNSDVMISDRERTLVDLIYFPKSVGGIKKAFEILKDEIHSKKTDIRKFVKYVSLFSDAATKKRIGYILDKEGTDEKILKPLFNNINNDSFVNLYKAKSRKGRINKKWGLIENASSE